eukprot:TRINITY_DN1108_c0_g2_i3.p1 TRINITY_DN1108_c0_g2~~TRINITY_DN1108_c0_g2_i3.p1  ORF type:complete len:213 (+),score=15.70 TRINITY_DN1108_c0_g2_i3:354-992(+)
MYEFACTLPRKASGLKSSLLLELLENGIQKDLYEEKYFNEYLKYPLRMNYCKQNAETSGEEWRPYIQTIQSKAYKAGHAQANKKDKEIFLAYLDKMFRTGKTVASYTEYLDKDFLIERWEETQMTSGKKVEVTPHNAKGLEKIKNKVVLELCSFNKEVFALEDDVELFVDVQNVQSVQQFLLVIQQFFMTINFIINCIYQFVGLLQYIQNSL